jgi:DNA-binding transcriptional ArsR family regulator
MQYSNPFINLGSETLSADQDEACWLMQLMVHNYDMAARRRKDKDGRLGMTPKLLFDQMLTIQGIFSAPYPYTLDDLAWAMNLSERTVSLALKALARHGFVELSGPRNARKLKLCIPAAAVETYKDRNDGKSAHLMACDFGRPDSDMEVAEAIRLLGLDRQAVATIS